MSTNQMLPSRYKSYSEPEQSTSRYPTMEAVIVELPELVDGRMNFKLKTDVFDGNPSFPKPWSGMSNMFDEALPTR